MNEFAVKYATMEQVEGGPLLRVNRQFRLTVFFSLTTNLLSNHLPSQQHSVANTFHSNHLPQPQLSFGTILYRNHLPQEPLSLATALLSTTLLASSFLRNGFPNNYHLSLAYLAITRRNQPAQQTLFLAVDLFSNMLLINYFPQQSPSVSTSLLSNRHAQKLFLQQTFS